MDPFIGTWKVLLDKCTGVKEIGKLFGWSDETINTMASLEYTMSIQPDGDVFNCVIDYGVKKLQFSFKLGETFDYQGASGNDAKCVVTIEGGNLVENYNAPEGVGWKTERTVAGTNMTTVTTVNSAADVKCVQFLVKT